MNELINYILDKSGLQQVLKDKGMIIHDFILLNSDKGDYYKPLPPYDNIIGFINLSSKKSLIHELSHHVHYSIIVNYLQQSKAELFVKEELDLNPFPTELFTAIDKEIVEGFACYNENKSNLSLSIIPLIGAGIGLGTLLSGNLFLMIAGLLAAYSEFKKFRMIKQYNKRHYSRLLKNYSPKEVMGILAFKTKKHSYEELIKLLGNYQLI